MANEYPISTFCESDLCNYFRKKITSAEIKWHHKMDVYLPTFMLGKHFDKVVSNWIRDMSDTERFETAALLWLEPNTPCASLDDIPKIMKNAWLGNVENRDFLENVRHYCEQIVKKHDALTFWGNKRIALLDCKLNEPSHDLPEQLQSTGVYLRYILSTSSGMMLDDIDGAISLSHGVMSLALQAAANAVSNVLDVGEAGLTANFMVPIKPPNGDFREYFSQTSHFKRNFEDAENLWTDCHNENRLLIVGETQGADHLGFWVPLIRVNDSYIPGAPQAYISGNGAAVIKIDKPPLRGFCQDQERKWHKYIEEKAVGCMFVSLPFVAPSMDGAHHQRSVVSVLNVNVDPESNSKLFRAYQPEWLQVAQRVVEPFCEVAHLSYLNMMEGIRLKAKQDDNIDIDLELDTGSIYWNRQRVRKDLTTSC